MGKYPKAYRWRNGGFPCPTCHQEIRFGASYRRDSGAFVRVEGWAFPCGHNPGREAVEDAARAIEEEAPRG